MKQVSDQPDVRSRERDAPALAEQYALALTFCGSLKVGTYTKALKRNTLYIDRLAELKQFNLGMHLCYMVSISFMLLSVSTSSPDSGCSSGCSATRLRTTA